MRYRKTYAVYGLREAKKILHSNGATMNVHFENGRKSRGGEVPATYMTEDLFTQIFIENSEEFKSGRVKLVGTVELPGGEEPAEEEETEAEAASTAADTSSAPVDESGEAEVVQVSDMDEAKTYLCENHGYKRADLRSKVQFDAACKASGVRFDIADEQ